MPSIKIVCKASGSQETFEVNIESSDKISAVKEKIAAAKGDVEIMKLIAAGKILDNKKKASDYDALKPKDDKLPLVVYIAKKKEGAGASSSAAAEAEQNRTPNMEGESDAVMNLLVGMGYEKEQVLAALRAAYNNPDRAMQYLSEGLPQHISDEQSQANVAEAAAETAQQLPASATDPVNQLRHHPQFGQIRQMVQQNPGQLPAILQMIGQTSPQLLTLITNHQDEFVRCLQETVPVGPITEETPAHVAQPGGPALPEQGSQVVPLTPEEAQAVTRLQNLGFDRQSALEAYLSCEKNEEMAANFLFDNMAD